MSLQEREQLILVLQDVQQVLPAQCRELRLIPGRIVAAHVWQLGGRWRAAKPVRDATNVRHDGLGMGKDVRAPLEGVYSLRTDVEFVALPKEHELRHVGAAVEDRACYVGTTAGATQCLGKIIHAIETLIERDLCGIAVPAR